MTDHDQLSDPDGSLFKGFPIITVIWGSGYSSVETIQGPEKNFVVKIILHVLVGKCTTLFQNVLD